jgi:ABC-type nitrate/sulfonate/bicarbonate transport system permease component
LFDPYVQFLRFVPPISLISGIGEAAKISLIVFTTTFLVLLSTINGVQATPKTPCVWRAHSARDHSAISAM